MVLKNFLRCILKWWSQIPEEADVGHRLATWPWIVVDNTALCEKITTGKHAKSI